MTKAQRNHNPVNLRFAGQKEAIGTDDDNFARFPTDPAGWRAAHAQIKLDQNRGLTIEKFIFKFAPPNENNTNAYLDFVLKEIRISGNVLLSNVSRYALAGVMAQYEGYNKEEDNI